MYLNKEYSYNADRVILLVCDYYNTECSPRSEIEEEAKGSVAAGREAARVEMILENLYRQNFYNVVITGREMDSLIRHLAGTKKIDQMNISIFKSAGNTLGDVFRELDDQGIEFRELMVMYVDGYVEADWSELFKWHRESEGCLMTLYAYGRQPADGALHVYGRQGNEIVFYRKMAGSEGGKLEGKDFLRGRRGVVVDSESGVPSIAVVSRQVSVIFTENFDFCTLGDLIEGTLASKVYEGTFQMVNGLDLAGKPDLDSYAVEWFAGPSGFSSIGQKGNRAGNTLRNRRESAAVGGEAAEIKPASGYCFELVDGFFFPSEKLGVHCVDSETIMGIREMECGTPPTDNSIDEEDEEEEEAMEETFFKSICELLGRHSFRFEEEGKHAKPEQIEEILKQISLLRIVWNASRAEVIEALGTFFAGAINPDTLEESFLRAVGLFGMIPTYVSGVPDGEILMEALYSNLFDMPYEQKVQVFFNYGYLFVQENIIDKSVVKKYNKMYKSGVF